MEKLFALIKALEKEEKRVFKRYAQGLGKKNNDRYILIFDAINAQEIYNEEAIKEELANVVDLKYWSNTKKTVYQLILKSVRVLEKEEDASSKILNGLKDIAFLYKKELYRETLKEIKKVKKIALTYQQNKYLPIINQWEIDLEGPIFNFANWEKSTLEQWMLDTEQYQSQLNLDIEYSVLRHTLAFWRVAKYKNTAPNKEDKAMAIARIKASPLLTRADDTLSFRSRLKKRGLLTEIYHLEGAIKKMVLQSIEQVNDYNAHPPTLENEFPIYFRYLQFAIRYCNRLSMWEELDQLLVLQTQLVIPKKVPGMQISKNFTLLEVYLRQGHFDTNIKQVDAIRQHLLKYQEVTTDIPISIFYYRLALFYFGAKIHDSCSVFLNYILRSPHIEATFKTAVLILESVTILEQKEFILLESKLKGLYYFFNKKEQVIEFELSIVSFLRQLSKNNSKQEEQTLLQKHKEELLHYIDQHEEQKPILFQKYFDYYIWLDSKIQNRPFDTIYRETNVWF